MNLIPQAAKQDFVPPVTSPGSDHDEHA